MNHWGNFSRKEIIVMAAGALQINPRIRFAIRYEGEQRTGSEAAWRAIHLALPVRGRALRRVVVDRREKEGLFEATRQLVLDGSMDLTHPSVTRERDELLRLGLLVDESAVSKLVAFEPWLVEPTNETSRAPVSISAVPREGLRLAPVVYQAAGASLPSEVADEVILERRGTWGGDEAWLLPGHPRVWMRDPGSDILLAYGVPEWLDTPLRAIMQGDLSPADLSPQVLRALSEARVLVGADYQMQRRAIWDARCAEAHAQFISHGFFNLGGLLDPRQGAALRRYFREVVAEGYAELQPGISHGEHNEAVCRYFHRQFVRLMTRIVGEVVKPSYTFFRAYVPGAVLKRHTDRPPSHFTISLLVDFLPETDGLSPWPVYIERDAGKPTPVYQRIGDGLFFEGIKSAHFRERLPENCSSTSIFFHYAPESYVGPLR